MKQLKNGQDEKRAYFLMKREKKLAKTQEERIFCESSDNFGRNEL